MSTFKTRVRQDNRFATMFMNTLVFVGIIYLLDHFAHKRVNGEEILFVSLIMGLPALVFCLSFYRKWRQEPSFLVIETNQLKQQLRRQLNSQ